MQWLQTILAILGVAETAMPLIQKLLAGIGTFVSQELSKVFGQVDAAVKLDGIIAQAETGVKMLDQGLSDVAAELEAIYPTVKELFAAFPGLPQSLTLRRNIVLDNPGISHGTAAKVIEAAHANVRMS